MGDLNTSTQNVESKIERRAHERYGVLDKINDVTYSVLRAKENERREYTDSEQSRSNDITKA